MATLSTLSVICFLVGFISLVVWVIAVVGFVVMCENAREREGFEKLSAMRKEAGLDH